MEMSLNEIKYLCEVIHRDNPKKSLLPVLFAMNYLHQGDGEFVTASDMCPQKKKDGYHLVRNSAVVGMFDIKKRREEGGYHVNYLRFLGHYKRIGKNHEHHDLMRKIRITLNEHYGSNDRVQITPILIFVYLAVVANKITTSSELKQYLLLQGVSYVDIAYKQLKLLHRLNLLSIERCDDNNRKLGYTIQIS